MVAATIYSSDPSPEFIACYITIRMPFITILYYYISYNNRWKRGEQTPFPGLTSEFLLKYQGSLRQRDGKSCLPDTVLYPDRLYRNIFP